MIRTLKSAATTLVKRGRIFANNHGYDIHPVDQRCWEDQIALLQGRKDVVIFDVGANGGEVATQYRKMFPNCRLYCFEPQKDYLPSLSSRFPGDAKVSFHSVAVGNRPGQAKLHVTASRASSSLLGSDQEHLPASYRQILAVEEEQTVEVVTLDDFAERENIQQIDILKMDIQGGECAALEGASKLLSAARIPVIYLEVGYVPMYMNHPLLGDVAKVLARHDYTLHFLYNFVLNGRSGRPLWGDAIFVSPQLYEVSREQLKGNWGAR